MIVTGSLAVGCGFHSLIALLVSALIVGAIYLTAESGQLIEEDEAVVHETTGNDSFSSGCDLCFQENEFLITRLILFLQGGRVYIHVSLIGL